MLSWSLIRKMFSVNVSFCQVNNLMLLHVWDLLSQLEQRNQSTLIPLCTAFLPCLRPWPCGVKLPSVGKAGAPWAGPSLPPCCVLEGLCRQGRAGSSWSCPALLGHRSAGKGWVQLVLPSPGTATSPSSLCFRWEQVPLCTSQSHRQALSTPLLFLITISKSQWRSN